MENSKLLKIVMVIMIVIGLLLFANQFAFAADSQQYTDLSQIGNITNTNNTNNIVNTLNTTNTTNSIENTTNIINTTNTSGGLSTNSIASYNNTVLPNTGLDNPAPVALVGIIIGVSAVYAYKKVQDYKNI